MKKRECETRRTGGFDPLGDMRGASFLGLLKKSFEGFAGRSLASLNLFSFLIIRIMKNNETTRTRMKTMTRITTRAIMPGDRLDEVVAAQGSIIMKSTRDDLKKRKLVTGWK